MGPCFKSYLSYTFAWPVTMRDQAKMILAGHHVQRLPQKICQALWCICDSLSH